jgi:AhpD family alkylhydroperoxidase
MAQIDPRAPRSSPLLPHSRSAPCTSLIAAIAVLAAAAGLWLAGQDGLTAQGPPSADQDLGQAVHVGDVIIRRYDPTPALITRVTLVDRPRFPVTDIHAHWTRAMEPAALLDAMDDVGVERAVNLSGGSGDELDEMLERFHQVAPGRLAIFANIDFDRIDEPGFGRAMAAMLERAHARGAAGLKIFKSLGLTIRDGSGRLVPIDDARLDPIWAMCGTLGVPVLIHSADPVAFFAPVDGKNERWLQLQRFPGWSVHGPPFPAREDVLRQRDRVLERHPNTRFIGAHMGGNSEDLEALALLLRQAGRRSHDLAPRFRRDRQRRAGAGRRSSSPGTDAVFAEGALSAREKALIALGVAHAVQCPYCIDAYTSDCLKKGADAGADDGGRARRRRDSRRRVPGARRPDAQPSGDDLGM